MLIRFVLFNSIVVFALAYSIYFYDALNFLWMIDLTRFSFLIFGIYAALTIYLGIFLDRANRGLIHFFINRLTSIGLVGTIVGLMMLLHMIGSTKFTEPQQIIMPLFSGVATTLITTLFGMLFSLLLDFQVKVIFGKESHKNAE